MSKQYEFHPLAQEYRRMSAHDLGRMEEDMRERGYDPRFPIILYEGKILDGCNRYLAARNAKVKPLTQAFKGTAEAAAQFVRLANEERRHLTEQELNDKRRARVARVTEARAEGKSLRAIAEEEGVSEKTVRNDLTISGAEGSAPEIEIPSVSEGSGTNGTTPHKEKPPATKVTGKDGKKYPAGKPKTEKKAEEKKAGPVDGWGIPIQPHAEEAFKAAEKFDELLSLLRKADRLYSDLAELPGGAYLTRPGVSMNARDRWKHKGIKDAILAVEDCKPTYTVCPYAFNEHHQHDENCNLCHGLNWVRPLGKEEVPPSLVEKAKGAHGV